MIALGHPSSPSAILKQALLRGCAGPWVSALNEASAGQEGGGCILLRAGEASEVVA